MKLMKKTIKTIAETISGDNNLSFYRSGPKLVDFFNTLGFDNSYGQGFPTRWVYAEGKITELVQQGRFLEFLRYALNEEHYIDMNSEPFETQKAIIDVWNRYLALDKLEIRFNGQAISLAQTDGAVVTVKEESLEVLSTAFMIEQINKCESKIDGSDYDGAITNARSLVEEVLLAIEEKRTGQRGVNDGDIGKIYNRVKKLINFDPAQEGMNDPLKQILSGLNSIVTGLGRLRNKASDSHAREYKPLRHHAVLAVNAAKIFTDFILSSYSYQTENKK